MYGGFAGTENALSQRNIAANPTILSGDLNGDDNGDLNRGENSYHVIVGSGNQATAILDGFKISGGNADGTYPNDGGGGVYSLRGSPTIRNCAFTGNRAGYGGGGIGIGGACTPAIIDCTFQQNIATGVPGPGYGGAIYASGNIGDSPTVLVRGGLLQNNTAQWGGAVAAFQNASIVLVQTTIQQNSATSAGGCGGAALAITNGTLRLVGCQLKGNQSSYRGGAIFGEDGSTVEIFDSLLVSNQCVDAGSAAWVANGGSLVVSASTVVGNRGGDNGSLSVVLNSSASIVNTLLWSNTRNGVSNQATQLATSGAPATFQNSTVQGWTGSFGGTGNNGSDPLFLRLPLPGPDGVYGTPDDDYGDLRVSPNSPANDSGDSAAIPPDTYDINSNGNTTESLPIDLLGFPRFVDDPAAPNTGIGTPPLDRGCYETQVNCLACPGPREWRSPLGGAFDYAGNWSPSVPQPNHDVLFNLAAAYTVSFPAATTTFNQSATVHAGSVSLNLGGGSYSLTSAVNASLVVGDTLNQPATLTISNGRVNAVEARIGSLVGTVGTVNVAGNGNAITPSAFLATTEGLCIGCQGTGTLNITGGARASCLFGFLGEQSGATGQVNISGPGSRLDAPFFLAIDNGNVNVSSGGLLTTGAFGTIYLFPSGTISGDGTVQGHVVNFGGISPGNSPGTLTINGNYDQIGTIDNLNNVSGQLIAQAAGTAPGQFDKLVVNGTATLGGGLVVSLMNGYQPSGADTLQLVTATGGLANPFDVIFFPALTGASNQTKYFRALYSGLRGPGAGSVTVNLGNLSSSPAFVNPQAFNLSDAPSNAAIGDLDGDGLPDVAITIPDPVSPNAATGAVVILHNLGGSSQGWLGFSLAATVPVGINPKAATTARLDGQPGGNYLVVANAGSNSLSILKNAGGGVFNTIATQATDPEPVGLAAADFTGRNGNTTIVVVACAGGTSPTGSLTMLANTSSGGNVSFIRRNITAPTGHRPTHALPFNPDNDKDLGLAVTMTSSNGSGDGTAVYMNGFDPGAPTPIPDLYNTTGAAVMAPVGAGPVQAMAGRLAPSSVAAPRGKHEDLITVNTAGNSISVLVNTGTLQDAPGFAPAVDYHFDVTGTTAAAPRSGAIVDLDGSGTLDVAIVANNPSGTNRVIKLLRNDSTVNLGVTQVAFAQQPDLAAGSKPIAVLAADVDGDGQPDLVTINNSNVRDNPHTLQVVRNALPAPSQSVGACCNGAGCVLQLAAQCVGLNQAFAGTNTACNAPGSYSIPCCKGDFDHNGQPTVADIFAFLTAWFASSPQADTNADSSVAIQDIFDFLGAWFGGC